MPGRHLVSGMAALMLTPTTLDRLPAEQREAFLLHIEGDLGIEEIATITRSSYETVKSRLRYARSKLRELLEDHA